MYVYSFYAFFIFIFHQLDQIHAKPNKTQLFQRQQTHWTPNTPGYWTLAERLEIIASAFKKILTKYKINEVAIEELFFNSNTKTALAVAQARGIYLLIAQASRIPIESYTPSQIKSGISGYGQASKSQVQYMVKKLLNLKETPKPDDAADALAIAICHHNTRSTKKTLQTTR